MKVIEYSEVSKPPVFRYCGFIHVDEGPKNCGGGGGPDCPIGGCGCVEHWINTRFEIFSIWAHENADSGPHIQFYGETNLQWNKSDTNYLGVRGGLGNHIPKKMAVKGAKRWSKQLAKKDRETNCAYVAKGGMKVYMSDGDPNDYIGLWKDNKKKVKTETFNQTLLRVWDEGGRPKEHRAIFMMLVESRCIPWNNFTAAALWRATDWLVNQCDMDQSKMCMERLYDEMSDQLYKRYLGK